MAVDPGYRCSVESVGAGEPMLGTASVIPNWLLVEHPGPWGRRGLEDARLPAGLGDELRNLERKHRLRVLLIRRPDRRTGDGVEVFAAHTGPDEAWLEGTVLDTLEEAVGLNLDALGHGRRPGLRPHHEALFAVCTHGRRDPCCAERGRPLARAVSEAFPGETWETTHVGGDRFAGNLVTFPHGLYFGRSEPEDGVAAALSYLDGRIDLERFRGRSCYPMDAQAAEHFLRLHTGLTGIDDVRPRLTRRAGARTSVRVTAGGVPFEVVVERTAAEPHRLTCHSTVAEPAATFSLVSIKAP